MKRVIIYLFATFIVISCQSNSSWIYEDFSRDTDIIPVEYKGEKTFLNLNRGEMVMNASYYDEASYFYEGIAKVKKDGVYYFVDKKIEPINDKKYVEAGIFSNGLAFAVEDFGKITAIDARGNSVFELSFAEEVNAFREGIAVFQSQEGKWGAINKKGEIVIEPKYDKLSNLSYHGFLAATIGDCVGIIDKNGNEVIPLIYDNLELGPNSRILGAVKVYKEDEGAGIIDLKNKIIHPFTDDVYYCVDSDHMVQYFDTYRGWKNKSGETIIPEKYIRLEKYLYTNNSGTFQNKDVAVVAEDEDFVYLIDKKGKKIADLPRVTRLGDAFDQNDLLLFQFKTAGAINTKGEIVIKDIYPKGIEHIGDNIYVGNRSTGLDVINSKGKIIRNIEGDFGLISYDECDAVHNRYVDIDGIISEIDSILNESSMPNGITPGLLMQKYGLDELKSGAVVASGEKSGFNYEFKVRCNYDYSSHAYYISSLNLYLDLKGAADRNYDTREAVYSKIKEYYSGNEDSRDVYVPAFSDFSSSFYNGTFTFEQRNDAWINGVWLALLDDGYAFLSIDTSWDKLINDDLGYDNWGTAIQYSIENNTIKPVSGANNYVINYEEEAIYYNGTVRMQKTSRIPYSISNPFISSEEQSEGDE